VPEIPHELDDVICQLLEKDPARRPGDSLVLQRQLDSIRRKLERKSQHTLAPGGDAQTVAEGHDAGGDEYGEGAATLMSRLMREELGRQKAGSALSQWFNRPVVLLPLFLVCVGLIVWKLWPHSGPTAEELFENGARLMASSEPADWRKGWNDYLAPLEQQYPNHAHYKEVEAYRRQINDYEALRKAVAGLRTSSKISEAQRLYLKGLHLCQAGDGPAAERVWRNLARAFAGVDSEKRWVELAEVGLAELKGKLPAPESKTEMIRQSVERVNLLRSQHKQQEANEIIQSLLDLYADDAAVQELLKHALAEPKK
jgi:serine/threonine-protein kinase